MPLTPLILETSHHVERPRNYPAITAAMFCILPCFNPGGLVEPTNEAIEATHLRKRYRHR